MSLRCAQLFILVSFVFVGISSIPAQSTQKSDPWRSIRPLVSNLKQVESLMGTPTKIDGRVRYYDTAKGERVTVSFTGESDNSSCKWQVPDDTAIRVIISPRKRPLLSQIGFDLTEFKEARTPDGYWNFVNAERGIFIHADESENGEKVVVFLEFVPVAIDEKRCVPKSQPSVSEQERQSRIKQSDFVPPFATVRPELFDLYFHSESKEKKEERLKAYADELSERPYDTAVIVSYGTRGKPAAETNDNLKFSLGVINLNDRFEMIQLMFIDGGIKTEAMTELYLVPPGAPLPIQCGGFNVTEAVVGKVL